MYSSIDERERSEVISKCYWPLFKLADIGVPIGLEAPGATLEIVNSYDHEWIDNLSNYIKAEKIEFIGSGYSQIIGPLVPAEINSWNQKLGLEVYNKLLGVKPKIALINEMAYSAGMIEHYINHGYETILMEWNNPRKYHPEWKNEWRYYPQRAKGSDDQDISLIWADSIAFQKFQRYVHAEINLEEYVQFIKSHLGDDDRYFSLYSNDVEIFDYRPGRYHTEADIDNQSEWNNIIELYTYLENQDWSEFVFPSEVILGKDSPFADQKLHLESPSQPIPVKKQEKYNINRWALTGRDDLGINTKCYRVFQGLDKNSNTNPEDWKELCYLWSSDFRTHITEKRWKQYLNELGRFSEKWCKTTEQSQPDRNPISDFPFSKNDIRIDWQGSDIEVRNTDLIVLFDTNKGMTIKSCTFNKICNKPIFGTLEHGYYDDISFGADFFSTHALIERPATHKISDLYRVVPTINERHDQIEIQSSQEHSKIGMATRATISGKAIRIEKKLTLPRRAVGIFQPFHLTLIPNAWDKDNLYYSTCNGGQDLEIFKIGNSSIRHKNIYSTSISAVHGFGSTSGILKVGDKNKCLVIKHDPGMAYLSPRIIYEPLEDELFFLRVIYSAQEIDETFKEADFPQIINSVFEITAEQNYK